MEKKYKNIYVFPNLKKMQMFKIVPKWTTRAHLSNIANPMAVDDTKSQGINNNFIEPSSSR